MRAIPNFDEYFPFDPGNGASANSARWRKMAQLWQSDGVVANYLNELNATLAGTTLTVQTGAVFIHGYYAEIQTPPSGITVTSNGTLVAQVQFANEVVTLYYKDTVVDYGPSALNNYEQSANNWEIPLWLISSGTLVDLRTKITPAADLGWWNHLDTMSPVAGAATLQSNFLTARIPYTATGFLTGTMLLTFSDLSQAQSAQCTLTYQYGLSDQQTSPTITPAITGGGPAGQSLSIPVSLSGAIPVTPGKKAIGWRVTAGTGPQIQVQSMTLTLSLRGRPAAA